jgi:dipeptidyl aminopeptidase/acylaminoacyl peptidase
VLLSALLAAPAAAQKKPFTPEKLLSLKRVADPQVSPDGQTVLFTITTPDTKTNARPTQIWRVPSEGGTARQLTHEGSRNQRPRWSPDGRRIAFLSNQTGIQQIWMMDAGGGSQLPLSASSVDLDGILWSPDGTKLLFTADVYPDCRDLACTAARDAEREKSPVKAKVFDRLLYRHWTSFKDQKRSHLFVMPAAGGAPIDLTPGDFDVPPFSLGGPEEYAFSPDSREVAYTSDHSKVEATSTNKDIFLVPVTGGASKQITTNPAWDATAVYSPDGRYIAYRAMRRAGYEADRFELMLYDRQTGERRSLTPNYDRSVDSILWSPDSRRIYFTIEDLAAEPVMVIEAAGGEPRYVVRGATNGDLGITADGRTLVFTRNSLERPNEVFRAPAAGATDKPQAITHVNEAALADTDIRAPESFSYAGAGGATIQAWLLKPPGFDPAKKYPVMFLIHGGPQGAWNDGWTYRWNAQTFAGAGYVVVMPNVRGSTGFGQKFTDEINSDWGGRSYEDIMRGVAYVEKLPYVDPQRFGASGASYGGYMIDWIAGHTGRFRCLVTHDGVFDLAGEYGSTEELWFPEWEFKGTPWTNPEEYRKWSPSSYVQNFKTPTLVIHGQLDYRVDVSQGLEMFTALQKMNVPSKMLYFPDEGHWVLKPANSALWYKEVIGWWDKWLK